ncbi:unnamed protein product [Chironomus riparius]|uniref:Uncharacterized protein n=1 Tax=Chironomus riparius TaxID=315576 RepID=A0A9N9S618_9DIPT|nr:unnamed protein product [Chironomus riparius]
MILLTRVIKYYLVLIYLSYVALQGPPRNEFERNAPYGSTFKSVVCDNFADNLMHLRNCSVKAYTRNFTTLNFGLSFRQSIKKPIFMKIVLMYRYGNIYRDVLNKIIEICSIFANLDANPVFLSYIDIFEKSVKSHFHKCPYSGSDDYMNLTIDESSHRNNFLNPEGFFKVCVTLLKPADKPHARLCTVLLC